MSLQGTHRVVSGMRPTGRLHLGHYHGVLKNWLDLQHRHECLFFVADWHALTTHYEDPQMIEVYVWEMIIDWLAVGISPGAARLFIQSQIPEQAELHLLLSMITPLSWLERVPTYKDQKKDFATYGFLGYPLLQSADILAYKANIVPVGEDQVAHVELAREIARRFNHIYGREQGFTEKAEQAINKMGKKNAKMYRKLRRSYTEKGDAQALEVARALLESQQNISLGDRERLFGYLEGMGKIILPEPQAMLTTDPKTPGLDGRKMSKSYGNGIALREEPAEIEKKLRAMPTDPARVRRGDPGEPEKCPVWPLHRMCSDDSTQNQIQNGCRSASIGCMECKTILLEAIEQELNPIRQRAMEYTEDQAAVRAIIHEGNEAARDIARATIDDVSKSMHLNYK